MAETHSAVDRLETRLDSVAGRVDALYSMLEVRRIPASPEGRAGDAFFDELLQIEESPLARMHVASGSGV
jgi:hypothetical protein